MSIENRLDEFRPLFAHKAFRREPTLRPGSDASTMGVLNGKLGTIFPYGEEELGVDYVGWPAKPSLSERKLSAIETKLKPWITTFRRLDGEYAATFKIEHLEAVAKIIGVRRRRTAPKSVIYHFKSPVEKGFADINHATNIHAGGTA